MSLIRHKICTGFIYKYASLVVVHAFSPVLLADKTAKEIYMQTCYVCHGEEGEGNIPGVKNLSENKQIFKNVDNELVAKLKQGIDGNGSLSMPAKGGNPDITEDQLHQLLDYIRILIKPD